MLSNSEAKSSKLYNQLMTRTLSIKGTLFAISTFYVVLQKGT